MATVPVTGRISTKYPSDTYATHSQDTGLGGYRGGLSTVADIATIPVDRRYQLMMVGVKNYGGKPALIWLNAPSNSATDLASNDLAPVGYWEVIVDGTIVDGGLTFKGSINMGNGATSNGYTLAQDPLTPSNVNNGWFWVVDTAGTYNFGTTEVPNSVTASVNDWIVWDGVKYRKLIQTSGFNWEMLKSNGMPAIIESLGNDPNLFALKTSHDALQAQVDALTIPAVTGDISTGTTEVPTAQAVKDWGYDQATINAALSTLYTDTQTWVGTNYYDKAYIDQLSLDAGQYANLIALLDTPSTYVGSGGKLLAVTVGEDGVEFIDAPTGTYWNTAGTTTLDLSGGNVLVTSTYNDFSGSDRNKIILEAKLENTGVVRDYTNRVEIAETRVNEGVRLFSNYNLSAVEQAYSYIYTKPGEIMLNSTGTPAGVFTTEGIVFIKDGFVRMSAKSITANRQGHIDLEPEYLGDGNPYVELYTSLASATRYPFLKYRLTSLTTQAGFSTVYRADISGLTDLATIDVYFDNYTDTNNYASGFELSAQKTTGGFDSWTTFLQYAGNTDTLRFTDNSGTYTLGQLVAGGNSWSLIDGGTLSGNNLITMGANDVRFASNNSASVWDVLNTATFSPGTSAVVAHNYITLSVDDTNNSTNKSYVDITDGYVDISHINTTSSISSNFILNSNGTINIWTQNGNKAIFVDSAVNTNINYSISGTDTTLTNNVPHNWINYTLNYAPSTPQVGFGYRITHTLPYGTIGLTDNAVRETIDARAIDNTPTGYVNAGYSIEVQKGQTNTWYKFLDFNSDTNVLTFSDTAGTYTLTQLIGSGIPGGTGTEIQYRTGATTFGGLGEINTTNHSYTLGEDLSSVSALTGVVAIGYRAGKINTGTYNSYAISIGHQTNYFTGAENIGASSIAIGQAAQTRTTSSIAIGTSAGTATGTHGNFALTIGYNSNVGTGTVGASSITIGAQASGLADYSVNIGYGAGTTTGTANTNTISIGYQANNGTENIGAQSVCIGSQTNSPSSNMVVIGGQAGVNGAGSGSIYIGTLSGSVTGTHNSQSVSIGYAANGTGSAGNIGANSVALGAYAYSPGTSSISIGYLAGADATGGIGAIAIGASALDAGSADYEIALGYGAGNSSNTHGANAISIGAYVNNGSTAIGAESISLGNFLITSGANAISLGAGVSSGSPATNSTANSFKIYFGSATSAFEILGDTDNQVLAKGPVKLASYTVAGVPTASSHTGAMIYVSNETGGAVPAFSDGTNWRRVTDRSIIA